MTKPKTELLTKLKNLIFYNTKIMARIKQGDSDKKKNYVSYLKTENPNLDKTQEIKSRKRRKKMTKSL